MWKWTTIMDIVICFTLLFRRKKNCSVGFGWKREHCYLWKWRFTWNNYAIRMNVLAERGRDFTLYTPLPSLSFSFPFSVYVFASVSLSVSKLSVCLSVCLSACLPACLSACLPLSVHWNQSFQFYTSRDHVCRCFQQAPKPWTVWMNIYHSIAMMIVVVIMIMIFITISTIITSVKDLL